MSRQPLPLLFSSVFGILMVLTAARPTGPIGVAALGLSAVSLMLSLFVRRAAMVAVLLCIGAMAIAEPSPFFAAVSGLSAAAYLVLRYAEDSEAAAFTVPTVLGMLGFTAAGVAATAVSLQVKWVPLLAPTVVVAVLILVAMPLWGDEHTGALSTPTAEPTADASVDPGPSD